MHSSEGRRGPAGRPGEAVKLSGGGGGSENGFYERSPMRTLRFSNSWGTAVHHRRPAAQWALRQRSGLTPTAQAGRSAQFPQTVCVELKKRKGEGG